MTMAIMGSSAALVMICTAIFLAGRLQRVQGHLYLMTPPVSRNLWGTTAFNEPSFEFINFCLHCYCQSRGPAAIREGGITHQPQELVCLLLLLIHTFSVLSLQLKKLR
ncbi:unnamed protein product [Ascophyllum nodosum]